MSVAERRRTWARARRQSSVSRARRRTAGLIVFTVLAVIAGLVFVAVRADGRELSRATSNDGGAWVVNRNLGAVGHKNHATGEMSSFVRLLDRPVVDVFQSGDVVIVHDPTTNELLEIDPRSVGDDLDPTQLPEATTVVATQGAVIVTRTAPFAVWRVEAGAIRSLPNLDNVTPLHVSDGAGRTAVASDGSLVLVDDDAAELRWVNASGTVSEPISLIPPDSDAATEIIADVTIVDGSAIVLFDNGDLIVVTDQAIERVVRWAETAPDVAPLVVLQQPSVTSDSAGPMSATQVGGATEQGQLVQIDLGQVTRAQVRGSMGGADPLPPIAHEGCLYAVTVSPPVFGAACTDFVSQPLPSAGAQLRLKLVNGWVWVNDVETGETYATDDQLRLEELNDWSAVEASLAEDDDEEEQTGSTTLPTEDATLIEDPDADTEVQDSDNFDPGEANVPPVAVDDQASTRNAQALVVDVLANDFDLNNDILVVTQAEIVSGSGRVSVTPAGENVQVTPAAGFAGDLIFTYSISDGRSEPVSATVTVTVLVDQSNRPPEPVTDVVATAPGNTTTIDVIANDTDPDGDPLALASITTETGTLRWDPTGQVTYTPDTTTAAGWIELPYIVRDDRGAQAEGLLRVEIRDRGANQEPDARNDQATTVVGRSVSLNLLENDSDPDGDPLIVGSRPRLLEPQDAVVRTTVTADGEFVFSADVPGVYLFSYTVNDAAQDGSESDTARIRIDVLPDDSNAPPVAVRDEVVVPIGEPRPVYVLENDGDPDGDVVTIVNWQASPGLRVAELNDGSGHVGFMITVPPGGPRNPEFSYSISDGVNTPVAAPVVIAVIDRVSRDNPPFANDDVIEVRAGARVAGIDVLGNDFDPEGGPLRVVTVDQSAGVTAVVGNDDQSIDLEIDEDVVSSFSIAYGIVDQGGNSAAAVLRVQLIPAASPNRPPVARTDEARTASDQPVFVSVLANDSDPDNDAIALEGISTQPNHGSASTTVDGAVRYAPDAGFSGTDVLRYTIVDAAGDRAVGEVFIGVAAEDELNLPPIANDDSYQLAGRPTITPLTVLDNDFDPEGDALRVIDVGAASIGRVSIDGFGQIEYVPPVRLAQRDRASFTYVIADTAGNQARATVTIDLEAYDEAVLPPELPTPVPTPTPEVEEPTPDPALADPEPTATPEPTPDPSEANLAPIAVGDTRGPVRAGTEVTVDVLSNDSDPDGPASELTIVGVSDGALIVGSNVVVTAGEENAVVSYQIEDRFGATASATITILVTANQAPVVTPFVAGTPFETALTIDLSDQASDVDGDDLFFICCESVRGGVITNVVTAANVFTLTFTPDDGFTGSAGFAYRVDDQRGQQTAGSVSINVDTPVNQAPVTTPDTVQIPQGIDVTVDLARLSGDPDGDPVTRTLLSEPGGGISVQVNDATAVVSADRATAVGPAGVFTYEISDGVLTATGEVAIEVTLGANEAPTATSTAVSLPANSGTTIDLNSLANETDPGDSITFELDTASFGDLSVSLIGTAVQITAPVDAAGQTAQIGFTATDTRSASASGVIDVSVTEPSAPLPSASDDTANAEENQAVTIDALANDSDPLGLGLDLVLVDASFGTATIVGNQVSFQPGDNVGVATVNYTMQDKAERSASAVITIDTVGAPDQPAPPDVVASSGQVTLTWQTPEWNGPVGWYTILILPSVGATQTVDVPGDRNSYTWTGLTNGDTHQFELFAANDIGISASSGPSLEVTPNQKPEAPAPPSVVFGDEQLTVNWVEPTNVGSEITGYVLELSPDLVVEPFDRDTRSYTWPSLSNGQEYTFRVRAINAAGPGDFSQPSSPERPLREPEPPTIGAAQRTGLSSSLTVGWTPQDDNGDPIGRFRVQIDSNNEIRTVDDPTAESYDWSSGLTDGQDVAFRVAAENRAGWGDWSAWSNALPSCSAPDAVTDLVASRADGAADISWDDAGGNGCEVTNYTITLDEPVAVQNSGQTTFHNFGGLTNGTTYTFTITATNEIGTSVGSTTNPVIPAGPPICPVSGSVNSSLAVPFAVDLSWANAFVNNGAAITDYEVDSGSGFVALGSTAENTRISSLTEGTPYTFSIRARNSVGASLPCPSTSITTWDRPTQVELTATFDSETDQITVVPTGGVTNDGAPNPRYMIHLIRQPEATEIEQRTGTGTPATQVFTMTEDGLISARVVACNDVLCTERTQNLTIALVDPPDPMTAANARFFGVDYQTLSPTSGIGTRLWFAVTEPNDNGGDITEYDWRVRSTSSGSNYTDNGTVPADSSAAETIFNYNFFHGYSDHPQSRNFGLDITWELSFRARNEAGVADWSPWLPHLHRAPPATVVATENSGFCPGSLDSCAPVQLTVYGLADFQFYEPQVFNSVRSGRCGQIATGRDGAYSGETSCTFVGLSDAPFSYSLRIAGITVQVG